VQPLPFVAAELYKPIHRRCALHTLGDCHRLQAGGHLDDCTHDGFVMLVFG
jgi:hypothetical protein